MSKVTVTMKMDKSLHKAIKSFCDDKGYIIGSFVEKAVLDRLEKEELIEDLTDIAEFESDKNTRMISEKEMKKNLGL